MRKTILAVTCLLVMTAGAVAQDVQEQIDSVIARMNESTGEEYLKARGEGVALAPQAKDYLEQKAVRDNWSSDNWHEALYAELLVGWSENSTPFSRCYDLKGLKPENYQARHLPRPSVRGELQKLGESAVPAMIEIFLKTLDSHPLGTLLPGPGADAATADSATKARRAERRALQTGIIAALTGTADKRAFRFLSEVLEKSKDDEIRVLATDAVSRCGGEDAVSVLGKILSDKNVSEAVRAACAHALGYAKSQAALNALKDAITDSSTAVRAGTAKGLAWIASLRRWHIQGSLENPQILALREAASAALAERLAVEADSAVRREIVQALGRIADASVLDILRKLSQENSDEDIKAAASDAAERISRKAATAVGGE